MGVFLLCYLVVGISAIFFAFLKLFTNIGESVGPFSLLSLFIVYLRKLLYGISLGV